jgi:hypothetical protein
MPDPYVRSYPRSVTFRRHPAFPIRSRSGGLTVQRSDFKKSHHFDFAGMASAVTAQTDAFANKARLARTRKTRTRARADNRTCARAHAHTLVPQAIARKTFSQTQIAALQQNPEGGNVPAWVAFDRKAIHRIGHVRPGLAMDIIACGRWRMRPGLAAAVAREGRGLASY